MPRPGYLTELPVVLSGENTKKFDSGPITENPPLSYTPKPFTGDHAGQG